MLNSRRPSCVLTILLCLLGAFAGPTAKGQTPPTALDRQLSRIDLGISGVGMFTRSVSGTNYLNVPFTQSASNTLGALVTLRYTKSPYLGFEFNYGYVRYTETFRNNGVDQYIVGGAQTNANEYTVGYVAHPPKLLFGVKPFLAGGLGVIDFKPTTGGGQGLQHQGVGAYYYAVGAEQSVFSEHFGIRAQVRQVFFTAPDFYQNYLTIQKRTSTFEPGIGFYLKF
jgi:hypothetical protein